jgi:hypothetical protein
LQPGHHTFKFLLDASAGVSKEAAAAAAAAAARVNTESCY